MNIRISEKHGINPSLMLCYFCNEESTGIALMGKLLGDEQAPRQAVHDMEPCKQCKEYMEMGIIVISIKDGEPDRVEEDREFWQRQYDALNSHQQRNARPFIPNPHRTGGWWVVSEDFIRRNITPPELLETVLKCRFTLVEDDACNKLGLFKEDGSPITPEDIDGKKEEGSEEEPDTTTDSGGDVGPASG